ncbi:MAG: glycoside hydrolase family 5 protein [Myxococcota bacterium]|nr:glycoside hydrolase family 5 protein [Myxococcota bacterium]
MRTLRFVALVIVVSPATDLGCGEFNPDVIRGRPPSEPDTGLQSVDADAIPDAAADVGLPDVAPVGPEMTGLHVVANRIVNGGGQPVVLHGVNRSGTEYRCVQGGGIFEGPSDEASVQAIVAWKASAVRIPLNESCWLGINNAPAIYSGDHYKNAIENYVTLLHKYHIVPILELHWVGPGLTLALGQQPMPDADHARDFWTDVATAFRDDDGVVFEPFNEPYPSASNVSGTNTPWQCWRDGCSMVRPSLPRGVTGPSQAYTAVGMQALVDAIRRAEAGVAHVILLGGLQYSNDLSQWLAYEPSDPAKNIGAAWHIYNNNQCRDATCWNTAPAAVAALFPIVATEIGENDCVGTFIAPLMQWLDASGSTARAPSGYLAWSWNAFGTCRNAQYDPDSGSSLPGQPYSLIADYVSGAPNGTDGSYAQVYHDHIAAF